jgi:hypothetical protein
MSDEREPLDSVESIMRSLYATGDTLYELEEEMRADLDDDATSFNEKAPSRLLRRVEILEQIHTAILATLTALAGKVPILAQSIADLSARVRKLEGRGDDEGAPIQFDFN